MDEFRRHDRGRIEARLISAGHEDGPDIFHGGNTAAHCKRHKDFPGRPFNDVQHGFAAFHGGSDIKESQFIGLLPFILGCKLHGITGVAEEDEIRSLDNAACLDIKTRNDSFCQHGHTSPAILRASEREKAPA